MESTAEEVEEVAIQDEVDGAFASVGTFSPRRFPFNKVFDLVLLRCVVIKNPHTAAHGKVGSLRHELLDIFADSVEYKDHVVMRATVRPKPVALTKRFKELAEECRAYVKKNGAMSGPPEEFNEYEETLDTLILELDDKYETERQTKYKKTLQEKKRDEAAENIRARAFRVGHANQKVSNEDTECAEDTSVEGTSRRKKHKKGNRSTPTSAELSIAEKELLLMEKDSAHRWEMDDRRMKLASFV